MISFKKYLFLLLLIVCGFGCSDHEDPINQKNISGNWIWVKSTGGIDGRTETPETTGKVIRLEISKHSVRYFVNNELTEERSYIFKTQQSILFGKPMEMILYENGSSQIIEGKQDELLLTEDCFDCFQHDFIRE